MARYGVQVVGRGRQCFVVANLPSEGGFRKGPMPEAEAMALAQQMSEELRAVAIASRRDRKANQTSVVGLVLIVAAALIAFAVMKWW